MENKHTFVVEGFTCANCAAKFEKNVRDIPGVQEAKVNFGASKLTIYGEASVKEIEQAGAFENLKVYNDRKSIQKQPLWRSLPFLRTSVGGILLLLGVLSLFPNGENAISTIALFVLSMVIGGYALFWQGLKNLTRLEFDMRTLMTIAIIGAVLIGEWVEGAVVVFLFAISEVLERYSMDRARNSIRSLMELAPNKALIRREGREIELEVELIDVGDILIIKPGDKVPMDGIITQGTSTLNQASITGESIPVFKRNGDEVFAGTLNEEGLLEIKVTKLHSDTKLAKIIHLVEEAQAEKAPSQAFVDRFAKYYTPLIMLVALGVAIIPPLLFSVDWQTWIYQGLAVLVVGCPCALVISTPVAIVTAIGNAARNGVLIKGGVYLEEMAKIKTIAFDKTGTLTEGTPTLVEYSGTKHNLEVAAALENRSTHPLAKAFMDKAKAEGLEFTNFEISNYHSLTGKGLMGDVNGETYYLANPKLFRELHLEIPEEVENLQRKGKTVVLLGTKEKIEAIFAIADEPRQTSKSVIDALRKLDVSRAVLLTGDNKNTAKAIGEEIGLTEIHSELLPEDKLDLIKQLQLQGKVAMVGDGVNDAPALATATVGIAMGGAGTDTALETADIALMADDLTKLPFLIRLSQKTLTVIKQNIALALGLKIIALLLVIPGWLTLWIAIFADMGATLLVMLNGLRLLKIKEKA